MFKSFVRKLGVTSEPVIFIYIIIFVNNITLLPQLVLDKLCVEQFNTTMCADHQQIGAAVNNEMQRQASVWVFTYVIITLTLSAFAVFASGPVADIFGYRFTLVCIPVLGALQQAVAFYYSQNTHLTLWLLVSSGVFVGLFGDLQGVIGISSSILAIATAHNEHSRTARIAMIEVCLFLASGLSGIFVGPLLQAYGYTCIYAMNIMLYFVLFVYVVFIIPGKEELLKTGRSLSANENTGLMDRNEEGEEPVRENTEQEKPFLEMLKVTFLHIKTMWIDLESDKRKYLICLLFLYLPSVMGFASENSINVLYLKNVPFNLEPSKIGYFLVAQSLFRSLGVLLVSLFIMHVRQISDYSLLVMGLLSQSALYLALGVSRSFVPVIVANACGIMSPLPASIIRTMTTKLVPVKHHCTVLGLVMTIDVLSFIIANLTIIPLYALTLHVYSGISYLVVSGIVFCSALFFCGIYRRFGNSV